MTSGVYEIRNIVNGKRYVGSSANIEKRFAGHRWHLARNHHHSPLLQRSWSKHGAAAFEFKILILCAKQDLLLFEQRAIDAFCPEFNICAVASAPLGGRRPQVRERQLGKKRSSEVCANISKGRIGTKSKSPPPRSLEWRAKQSAAHMGQKRSPSAEHRAKISKALTGIERGVEWRTKQSEAQKKRTHSEEERTRMRELGLSHRGKKRAPRSTEWRAKQCAARLGKPRRRDQRTTQLSLEL